jgi:UDP-3-O-[3-hydroxymyristoyl] glucosamine N-acyltransferase
MAATLGELADRIGAELHGDAQLSVARVATLDQAEIGDLSFLYNRRYRKFLKVTAATAVILTPSDLAECPVAALVMDNPYLGYAKAVTLLAPGPEVVAGIHPAAVVEAGAEIDPSASVGAHTVIGAGCRLGAQVVVGPGSTLGRDVRVGDFTRIAANVTLCDGTSIGRRCIVHPGAVIGADGFGFAREAQRWVKIPQIGAVHIGDDVEIGANTTIDRGALKDTIIEDGVKIDNLVQIGHNCYIGEQTAVAGCVGIAGSVTIGRRCLIGGAVGIAGHIEIGDDVTITAMTGVHRSINKAGVYSSAWPAQENRVWHRYLALLGRLVRERGHASSSED